MHDGAYQAPGDARIDRESRAYIGKNSDENAEKTSIRGCHLVATWLGIRLGAEPSAILPKVAEQAPRSVSWNIAPTQDVGVIVPEEGGRIYKTMRWGLVPLWAKDTKIGNQAVNARIETAAAKPRAGALAGQANQGVRRQTKAPPSPPGAPSGERIAHAPPKAAEPPKALAAQDRALQRDQRRARRWIEICGAPIEA